MSKFIPNSYQTPNAYVDDYMALLSAEEWKVLSYMSRRIFGFGKRQDRISFSQFTNGIVGSDGTQLDYGTGLSRPTVIKAVASLKQFGFILEVEGRGSTEGQCYELQLDADRVDRDGLIARQNARHTVGQKRTSKARAVNPINRSQRDELQSVPLTAVQSTPLTATGKRDLPQPVNAIDPHVIRGKPEEKQVEEESSDRSVVSPLAAAAAAICNYPERRTPRQQAALAELVTFLESNQIAPDRVQSFPDWWQKQSWVGRKAAKEQRKPSPPTPRQVIELWPEFDVRPKVRGEPVPPPREESRFYSPEELAERMKGIPPPDFLRGR